MQVTKVSLYSLRGVLREHVKGYSVCGYTVKPGFSNGLFLYGKVYPYGQFVPNHYVGF